MAQNLVIYTNSSALPSSWDEIVGGHNLLLSSAYFKVLDSAKPDNMQCYYVGFFVGEVLVGGALIQYLEFEQHKTFQNNKISCSIKNYLTKRYAQDVFIVGNNMLTGQNGFYFDTIKITEKQAIILLEHALESIQKMVKPSSLIIYKDYQSSFSTYFNSKSHKVYFKFAVQPNMLLRLQKHWLNFDAYLNDFSAKYRTRANTARKKFGNLIKKELDLSDIRKHQKALLTHYNTVAENAPFNTFFLPNHHFEALKINLGSDFKIFGYFLEDELVGFYTFIINKNDLDTYFLGYHQMLQKERQMYLNMLLDMIEYGINHQIKKIIFGRTALEIKSTIGAEPVEIFGLIKHNKTIINKFMPRIFPYLEPKVKWQQRKPFK
jgi:hypothetical protein